MTIRLLPLLSLTLAFAVACSGGAETPPVEAPPPPPVLPADGSVGVAECDDYITKMEECIGLSDPTVKPSLEASLKSTKESWLLVAGNAETRGGLAASCSGMLPSIPVNCRPGPTPVEGAEGAAGPEGAPPARVESVAAPAEPKPASTTSTPRGMHVPDKGPASMERSRPSSGGDGKKAGSTEGDNQSGSSSGSMGRSRPK